MKVTKMVVLINIVIGLPVASFAGEDLLIFDSSGESTRPQVLSSRPLAKQVSAAPVQIVQKSKPTQPTPNEVKSEDTKPENPAVEERPEDETIDGSDDYQNP